MSAAPAGLSSPKNEPAFVVMNALSTVEPTLAMPEMTWAHAWHSTFPELTFTSEATQILRLRDLLPAAYGIRPTAGSTMGLC